MSLSNQWTRRAGPVAAVAVVGALAVALTGCQNGSSPTGGGAGRVAAVVKGLDNPFFQTMQSGHQERGIGRRIEVDRAGRQLDHRHHRAGRQAQRPGRSGLQVLHRQPDHAAPT